MRWCIFWSLFFFSHVLFAAGLLEPANPTEFQNGCGSGWNRYLVPDEIPLVGCSLHNACNAHDVCYSKCLALENQDNPLCLYRKCLGEGRDDAICGSPDYVNIQEKAVNRKIGCDDRFYNQIIEENDGKPLCSNFAGIYRFAVQYFGGGSFAGLGTSGGLTKQQQSENIQAIGDLLATWPDSRVRPYLAGIQSGTVHVNWGKPLYFNQNAGLLEK
jgi:hypothetical protein